MLIEFSYGMDHYKNFFNAVSYPSTKEISKRELFENWGNRYTESGFEFQLINVPNSLLFAFVTTGLPENGVLHYNKPDHQFFLADSMETYQNNISNNLFGSLLSQAYGKSTANDMFDWGYDEKVKQKYFLKVPPEFSDDLYEIVEPYIQYSFNNNIQKLLTSLKNNKIRVYDTYGNSTILVETQKEKEKEKFKLNCTTDFWKYLIYDMFEGTMYKEFSTKNPYLVEPLIDCLVKLQNIYNETGKEYYDPSN